MKNLVYWLSTLDAYVYTSLDDCNFHGQPIWLSCKCYRKPTKRKWKFWKFLKTETKPTFIFPHTPNVDWLLSRSNSKCELASIHFSQLSLRPDALSLVSETGLLNDDMPNDTEDDSFALFVTSLIDDRVFWNHVFFEDDWASTIVAFSWWSRSWFLHSDSTSASFVCASSSSSSRISWSLSLSSGLSAAGLEASASLSSPATVSLVTLM